MKHLHKYLLLCIPAFMLMWGCRKVEKLPFYEEGKSVTLSANKTEVAPTPADAEVDVITFSWTNPQYATDTSNYKFVLEIDSAGRNFSHKFTKEVMTKQSASLTGNELNNMLLNYGFSIGQPYDLEARVISSYANNNEAYTSNVVSFKVTPYADPSVLTVDPTTTLTLAIENAAQHAVDFTWTKSFNGYSGVVSYFIEYDSTTKSFANPHQIAIPAGETHLSRNQGEINQAGLDAGIVGGSLGTLEFRVKAVTEQGGIAYSNTQTVTMHTYVPSYHFYLVGSINGWDINNPLELISDKKDDRWGKIFYSYVYMNAGDEFKFAKTPGDWGSAYGNVSPSGAGYTTGFNQGGNFQVTASGVYRVTIDVAQNMAYVQNKQVGIVGGMQGWDAGNPATGGLLQSNKFMILHSSNADEFKFHDGGGWDNSGPDKARWWGKGAADGLLDKDGNGDNLKAPAGATRSRFIWDGTDPQQLKYEMFAASTMRVVGDGMVGVNDWDPANSPEMTYAGNGVWTITLNLKAGKEIKFLSGSAWGDFDYEDDGDAGSSGAITKRKIKWTGGGNFSTPAAAGTYTITLDEYHQTVTIQ